MTVATELQNLNDNLLDAYDAVSAKSGTVPANKNTDNLADAITSIPAGGGTVDIPTEVDIRNSYTRVETSESHPNPSSPTEVWTVLIETCTFPFNATSDAQLEELYVIPYNTGDVTQRYTSMSNAPSWVASESWNRSTTWTAKMNNGQERSITLPFKITTVLPRNPLDDTTDWNVQVFVPTDRAWGDIANLDWQDCTSDFTYNSLRFGSSYNNYVDIAGKIYKAFIPLREDIEDEFTSTQNVWGSTDSAVGSVIPYNTYVNNICLSSSMRVKMPTSFGGSSSSPYFLYGVGISQGATPSASTAPKFLLAPKTDFRTSSYDWIANGGFYLYMWVNDSSSLSEAKSLLATLGSNGYGTNLGPLTFITTLGNIPRAKTFWQQVMSNVVLQDNNSLVYSVKNYSLSGTSSFSIDSASLTYSVEESLLDYPNIGVIRVQHFDPQTGTEVVETYPAHYKDGQWFPSGTLQSW